MSDCTKSVTGRIDGLICRLTSTPDQDELLTLNPATGRASLATFPKAGPTLTLFGRIRWPYLILDRTHGGKRWVRLAAMLTASMWLGGCTMQMDAQAVWPGKLNPVVEYQPGAGRTVYQGYVPPMPMDPPAADSPAWWHGADLGLRN